MSIKMRDWLVLVLGVVLTLLGGFQIAYDLESFQAKDFILSGVLLAAFAWLYFLYKYKQDKTLFDEYYSEKFYNALAYVFSAIVVMIWIIIFIFEKDNMVSINYIYGAIRLGLGLSLLYFSFIIMRESDHEQ